MILYGRYRSPYTRRVAVTLKTYQLDYQHRPITAWTHLDELRRINPVGRIPALVLDSGEVLVESYAIIDYLDELVRPDQALIARSGPNRRQVQRIIACATGALDKIVHALYARTMYPPEKIHQPWIDHSEAQATSALQWLEAIDLGGWLVGESMTQADVTTVVMFDFARIVNPALVAPDRYPRLTALADRCGEMPQFAETRPVTAVDGTDPTLPGAPPSAIGAGTTAAD